MKHLLRVCAATLFVLALSFPAEAQMGMGMSGPSMRGVWKPAVGSGSVYQMESKREGKREMEIAIVGAETAEGKPGHWLEMVLPDKEGVTVMRTLFVLNGKELRTLRVVVQPPNEEPMEMSMQMMGMMGQAHAKPQKLDIREEAERVGSESITTPAGTFECEHWRSKDKSAEFWISDKISPWGLVKMTSKDENMTLIRVLTGAKSRIRGTPRKMEDMMRRP